MKEIRVLLEDDTEVLGNGLGHVMTRQYLPVKNYMNLLNSFDIRSTFFVDIAHLIFLKENENFQDFKIQANIIEEMIFAMLKNKMDVQLHIHPQWYNAKLIDRYAFPTNIWNIGILDESIQSDLISKSVDYLNRLINRSGYDHTISSFKAGSWGLQPFNKLSRIFTNNKIKLILGPIKGMKINSLGIDYSCMEEDTVPYYCDNQNINQIGSSKSNLIVAPITQTYLSWVDLIKYSSFQLKKKFINYFDKPIDIDYNFPFDLLNDQKTIQNDFFNFSNKPVKTHMKINSQPFWYLKSTFNKSYNYVKSQDISYPLIIIETHTKDFKNRFNDIQKFIKYLKSDLFNIKFITISELLHDIESGICIPRIK